jgi:hypothetical protein
MAAEACFGTDGTALTDESPADTIARNVPPEAGSLFLHKIGKRSLLCIPAFPGHADAVPIKRLRGKASTSAAVLSPVIYNWRISQVYPMQQHIIEHKKPAENATSILSRLFASYFQTTRSSR